MNIVTILNKLKASNMIADSDEGMSLFSDCFNKFGISLLLLNSEDKFSRIVDLLKNNGIPLQKANGIYALRIFAIEPLELESIISKYKGVGELDFLKVYPELMAEPKNIQSILDTIKNCQRKDIIYKNANGYDMQVLLPNSEYAKLMEPADEEEIFYCLKKYMQDSNLLDRLVSLEASEEEDFNVALDLQKVENKICEEYLFPVEDGWKIVINNKEVNSFQEVKNTINTITKLNLSITFDDALLLVLFYKTKLSTIEIEEIIQNVLFKEGK